MEGLRLFSNAEVHVGDKSLTLDFDSPYLLLHYRCLCCRAHCGPSTIRRAGSHDWVDSVFDFSGNSGRRCCPVAFFAGGCCVEICPRLYRHSGVVPRSWVEVNWRTLHCALSPACLSATTACTLCCFLHLARACLPARTAAPAAPAHASLTHCKTHRLLPLPHHYFHTCTANTPPPLSLTGTSPPTACTAAAPT